MIKQIKFIVVLILGSIILSCKKEPKYTCRYFEGLNYCVTDDILAKRERLMAQINFDCDNFNSENYVSANILGKDVCFENDKDSLESNIVKGNGFTTSSPTFNTGTTYSNFHHFVHFGVQIPFKYKSPVKLYWIEFELPKMTIDMDVEHSVDSFFEIKNHQIRSDVKESFTKLAIKFTIHKENGVGKGDDFIEFQSIYGSQENSKLTINSVSKEYINGELYYNLDADFNCILYEDRTYSLDFGKWSDINGHIHSKMKAYFF
jgi:hypothetical protein